MSARLTRIIALVVFCGSCKSKSATAPSRVDAGASAASSSIIDGSIASPIVRDAGPRARVRLNSVDAVAVSSRVDNATETPDSLFDGDLDTAWSSKTGDLVGAWVAFRFFGKVDVNAIELTVGMTRTPELFEQNVRIAEVAISWAPILDIHQTLGPETTLVDHFAFDTSSRALQKIPTALAGNGVVKITVTKIKTGTKPSWREASISEVRFDDADGHLMISPNSISVGSFDPKPRGVLGIIPERAVPLRCLAALPNVPRVVCALGSWSMSGTSGAALMSIDKDGATQIASLVQGQWSSPQLPYDAWLRAEHDLKNGKALDVGDEKHKPTDILEVPWDGSLDVDGVTFRQRQTSKGHEDTPVGNWDEINGVAEMRFPGDTSFTKIFDESAIVATSPMELSLRPIGSMWLVERAMTHGSEGMYVQGGEAVLCDLKAKHCTTSTAPIDDSPQK